MPQEELELIGMFSYVDGDQLIDLFTIGYIESEGFDPGFYVQRDDGYNDGPFILPSLAFEAAMGEMYE